jgi:uncharacterized repeat protein (TIGR01451 family)
VIFGLWVLAVALAAWPAMASGAITTKSATIDGVTSTSAPPGSVMNATATADVSGGSSWRATGVKFGPLAVTCVDHDNQGSGSNRHASFRVTAPGAPGAFNVAFQPNEDGSCNGTPGSTVNLIDGLRVTKPAPNPDLAPRCGINVMLVLDESGSIGSSGQTETVKSATRAFLDALSGTGAKVSIVDFSSTASRSVAYTTVTPDTITNTFNPYLKDGYKPGGYTNWDAAMQKVREANTQGTLADLVVFITDGDPTAHNTASGAKTGLPDGDVTAMRPAAAEADLVKGQGSHVLALGVGAAVTKPASAHRLTAISGFNQLPPADLSKADYTLVQNFDDLAAALRKIANALCQASVTVTKLVDEGDGQYRPDPGWTFTATVSTSPGDYAWLQPVPPPSTGPRSETTNESGVASFQWKPSSASATSTIALDEEVKPGFRFVDATCTRNSPTRSRQRRTSRTSEPVTQLTLKPNEYYKCTVRNQILPGTIEIEKRATPAGSTPFPFTGSFGPFTLVDDDSSSSSKIVTGLAPGTYSVSELVPPNWELTGIACTPAAAGAIAGTQATITLAPGASVVCTYSDLRVDPPVPPEPPDPPVPPVPPVPPLVPPPAPSPPMTQLRVQKTAPGVAQVGQRVPFKLTVTNTGPVAATNVQMADIPSAAITLAGLSTDKRLRRVLGNAVWRLGTLAPGAKATIRGSVQIKAGTAGLKRNIVLATAVNAHLVSGRADTRIVRARRVPRRTLPRFTG